MIVKPSEMDFTTQKFSCIIYGAPGVGKTTLALSAPNPLLIDFDHGVSRVKAMHRAPTIVAETYEEVKADIESDEAKGYDTYIIDTGGSFVSYLQDWAMRTNPAVNKQKNGSISLKGFGAVKAEFNRFTDYVKNVLNKNIIFVFHATEQTDKDGNVQQRLMCEGAARNTVWNSCDFGGFVQMIGAKREICFSPEQEFFAKGTHGIEGHIAIPTLDAKTKNDFLTNLFALAQKSIINENEMYAKEREQYESVMTDVNMVIDGVVDEETANQAIAILVDMKHVMTSKKEASALLNAKAKKLGLKYANGKYSV